MFIEIFLCIKKQLEMVQYKPSEEKHGKLNRLCSGEPEKNDGQPTAAKPGHNVLKQDKAAPYEPAASAAASSLGLGISMDRVWPSVDRPSSMSREFPVAVTPSDSSRLGMEKDAESVDPCWSSEAPATDELSSRSRSRSRPAGQKQRPQIRLIRPERGS